MRIFASRRPWIGRTAFTGGLILLIGGLGVPAGAQDASSPVTSDTFSLAARAAPFAVELIDSGAPVIPGGQVLYVTPTVTRAELDSVGSSTGFAAAPYPGDALPSIMGASNAVSPTGPVFPEYPFSVSTTYPGNAEQAQERGPNRIASTSSENGSEADAHIGLARGNPAVASVASTSIAKHDPGTGALTAQANGVIDGFSLGPTLTIGRVLGHAEITAQPGQKPTKQTAFSLGTVTVMGTTVGLTDKGFVPVADTPPGADFNSLTRQLSQAGITVSILPANETETTIDSAGLAIGFSARDVPGHGLVKVTVTLGRVSAQLESGAPGESSTEPAGDGEDSQATTSASTSTWPRWFHSVTRSDRR